MQRNASQYTPGQPNFVYATVRQPNGQVIDPATIVSNRNAGGQPANTGTAAVQTNTYQPAGQQGGYGQGTPGFQGADPAVQTNAVEVNNQTVGYQMPGNQPAAQPAGNQAAGNAYVSM